jgi:hypothetical protein
LVPAILTGGALAGQVPECVQEFVHEGDGPGPAGSRHFYSWTRKAAPP